MDQQHDITVEEYAGARHVWVDGEDITNEVVGVELALHDGQATAVMLFAKPGSTIIKERGFIYVQPRFNATVLDDLDPAKIEEAAMNREPNDKRFIENVVDVIKELLSASD